MSFDKYAYPLNDHCNQDTEHFYQSQMLPASSQSMPTSIPGPRQHQAAFYD
jgi:hypothetical protein